MILRDRVDDIYNYDILQSYENCDYENFDKDNQIVTCETKIKNTSSLTNATKYEVDKEEYKNNNNLDSESNFHVVGCGNELFSSSGFSKNIGNYLLLACFLIDIILILIYYKKSIDEHRNELNKLIKDNYKMKEGSDLNLIISERKIIDQQVNSNGICLSPVKNKNIRNSMRKKKKLTKKKKKVNKNLNDKEMNDLNFEEAYKLDKRSFCQYYLYLIKKSNSILFIFYKNYDSRGMKIIIFIRNFCLNICVNQLFFTESTIHKIYSDENKYNFRDQLSHIVLSTIISSVIITISKLIVLRDRAINAFKRSLSTIKKKKQKKNRIN